MQEYLFYNFMEFTPWSTTHTERSQIAAPYIMTSFDFSLICDVVRERRHTVASKKVLIFNLFFPIKTFFFFKKIFLKKKKKI